MANDDDRQQLDAFASEEAVPPPQPNEIYALMAPRTASRLAVVFQARTLRWGGMVVLAFALGATLTWGLLRTLDPTWIRVARRVPSRSPSVAPVSPPTRGDVLPNAAPPIMVNLAPDVGRPAPAAREVVATASTVAAASTSALGTTPGSIRTEMPARSASRATASTLRASNVAGTHTTFVVPRAPAAPVVIPSSPPLVEAALPPPVATRDISAVAAATALSRAALDRTGVLETLRDYEAAYKALDVQATAAIWPSVDRRALARAFATIKSQGLTFDHCDVKVVDSVATARCRGTIQYVRRVGSPVPRSGHQEWLFKMRKSGDDWKIDEITASEISGAALSRSES